MKLNSAFVKNISDIHGKAGESWLNNLPKLINAVCEKQNLKFISIVPNLTYHFVGLAELKETEEFAILKMAPNDEVIANEAKCLECFSQGMAKIYSYDEEFFAIIMERLEPGYSLKKFVLNGEDDEATRIIARTIRELQWHQSPQHKFKHLSELIPVLSILDNYIDKDLLYKKKKIFAELTQDKSKDVILHGDLHHDNVLAHGKHWKAIDPHGYVGDPVFEVGSMIVNPFDAYPTDKPLAKIIERRIKILSEELPFDNQKIQAWMFCKTMLSVAWTVEDHNKIDEGEVEIARIINELRV